MYQTNQAFLEAMDDISRTLAVQVEIGGELYPTESIIDFELERGAFDGDVFTIGQILSSALTLTIFTTSSIKLGDEVKLFTDLWVGDSYVRVPMGVYYVDATSINQEKMTLTCYDKMVSLVEEYIPNGQHKTLSALFNDVRSQIGMTYDGAFTDVAIKAPLYGYTYRETLGFIASLNGGNMIINRSGNLEIKGYQAVERHIPAKTCFSFDVKEPYRVSKVFCQFGDVGVTRGDSSGQCVAFENPYVTEQNIDVIYQRLNGLNFTAGSLKYRGDLTLDPGDLFTFTDYKGDDYVLMCGRNKLTFNGGLSGQLESIGESEKANNYTELQLKYKKNLTKVTAELGKIQAVVQEIEQSHDGLEERVKNAELEMTADAITSKVKDTFVSKDEAGNLVTQEQLTSAIQQTSNDITLQVSSNYETKQNVTTKVNSAISTAASDAQTKANTALSSAKSYADTKKTEAINTASTDATNKANNAKNEAINSANNALTTTIANYYTKSQTDSAIKVAKEEINLGVSSKYETKTNVETKVSSTLDSAKSYSDTKKTEAINAASTDATNKVNSAKNELNTEINKKANSVDVYRKSETYTKAETDSKIKVAKDSIDLSVSTLQTTVANHTTQINSKVDLTTVNDKINAIQVGGRNLLPRARTFENWQGVGQNGVKVVKDGFKPGMNSLKFAQGGEVIVDDELQRKALKNLANTHMIVTNPEDSAYSLYPNPPKGSTFNSVNRDGSLRKGEISSNGSCWAIISAYKYYTEVPTTSAIEQKLLQIMKDCADFMCDNLSVGRFNSMNFEFIDTSYKYSSKTRAGWTVGTYKELYLSTMFLQVKSLTYAYKIHKNQRYLDTAYKVLDSLYNVQIYIKDKVAKGDLPTEADGAFYEYLACDNLSSSNRFSGSTKILPLGMGYYISQAVDTLIEIVGDNERTTAKGNSYRPSTIKTEYTKFLSSMIKTGNLTAKPTNLPYGHYYKSEDGTFKLGNWNFIDDAFGDEWFVGDVVCYTIIGLASLGFKTEAKQYMNAYYSLKVPNSSGRFTGDIVFYDRIDFSTGTHLPDDDSVSITYTSLYMEMGVILKEMTHVENCANTLLKWQVSEPNNIKVDGAYMWDISKDTSSLELKSYGEIVNSEFFKYLSPQKIRNRATTASVSTALTSNIAGKEFALSGWLKASNWNALASGLNACLKIGGKTYASLKLSDVIKNNNWTRFELLGSVEKEDEILTFELINNTSTTVEVAVLKLEKGNKITDFTDAPEDVEDNIVTSKNDAISSANNTLATTIANYYTKAQTDSQINVAKNAITQSVSSTYATKTDVTSSINGVNSSISSLTTRMSSAESKITDTAITNTVKQNFYTKTETDGKVTTVQNSMNSSITQLSNQIATKVDVNGVKSTIEQNPSSVQIGFNKISNALTVSPNGLIAKTQSGNTYFQLGYNGMTMYNPANGTHQWGKVAAINNKFTVASNGNSSGLSLGHHVNENYVEDILCDSNGVVSVQRQINHNGVFYNNYGQMFIRQSGQGGWEITGRSDSQAIKPGGANQGALGSNTQYINQSWIANRHNPSSLEFKHLSHYVDDLECLKLVSEVQPARYFYKEYDEEGNDITTFTTRTSQLGLIYEDVRECTGRDLITNEEDKAINLYNMVSTLWGAVRNLNQRLNELEIENLKLNNELDQIKATQKEAK